MPSIRCQISHSGFLVQGFAMAGSGIMGAPRSSSRSMYYTPLHAWGLPDVPDEFTPEELAENTRNEDDLHNVLRPIQAFNEYYWVRVPRRRVDRFHRGYLEPKERLACRIGEKEKIFPWHLFEDLGDVLMKGKNESYFRKTTGHCGGSTRP